MRRLLILSLILTVAAVSVAFVLPERPTRPSDLGAHLIQGLKNKDFNMVADLMPDVPAWKLLVPEQVEGPTDEEIEAKMEAGNLRKAEARFNEILQAGKEKHIRFRQLEFNQVVMQRYYENRSAPVGLEVLFFYDHYHGKVKISAIEMQDQWYLLEILDSADAFSGVKAEKKGLFDNLDF